MSKTIKLQDPVTEEFYNYILRDSKEQKLYDALVHVIRDECPPSNRDYLCQMDESEEQRCEECWIRWATKDFKGTH